MIKLALYCMLYFWAPALVKPLEAEEPRASATNRIREPSNNKWQKLYLASLARERALSELKNKHNPNGTTVIPTLPLEVLAAIFDFYLRDSPFHFGVLRLVSRSWDIIVQTSPSLWTRIYLVGPFRTNHLECWKTYIHDCVNRSGVLPLHVVFEVKSYESEARHHTNTALALLEYLSIRSTARWVSFTYHQSSGVFDAQHCHPVLRSILKNSTRLLEFNLQDSWQTNAIASTQPIFTPAAAHTSFSSLISLELADIGWQHVANMAPLRKVQSLSLVWSELWQWYGLLGSDRPWLSSFPSLRTLTLKIEDSLKNIPFVHDPGYGSLSFDRLASSTIVTLVLYGPIPHWFYRKIDFPLLQHLVIEANSIADHILRQDARLWDPTDNRFQGIMPEATVTLACAQCSAFWDIEVEDEMQRTLQRIQKTLEIFLSHGKVKKFRARSCVWRQIALVLGIDDDEVQDICYGLCGDFRELSANHLRGLLESSQNPATFSPVD
jgi:hypothetical protein